MAPLLFAPVGLMTKYRINTGVPNFSFLALEKCLLNMQCDGGEELFFLPWVIIPFLTYPCTLFKSVV